MNQEADAPVFSRHFDSDSGHYVVTIDSPWPVEIWISKELEREADPQFLEFATVRGERLAYFHVENRPAVYRFVEDDVPFARSKWQRVD